jgi:hypothetical protein
MAKGCQLRLVLVICYDRDYHELLTQHEVSFAMKERRGAGRRPTVEKQGEALAALFAS